MSATKWNGEPCTARRVTVTVADSGFFPGYWAREFVGTRRNAVEVQYGGDTFYLDDEDGSGWDKVTHGGGPRQAHRSLEVEPDSVEPRELTGEARRELLADLAEAFDVPAALLGTEAEQAHLHRQIERAIQAVQDGQAAPVEVGDERIVNAVMPIVEHLMRERTTARRTVLRAAVLADRWQAAHGSSMFLVRVASAELRQVLEENAPPCDRHPHAPVIGGVCGGCTQYPADMLRPLIDPVHVREALADADEPPGDDMDDVRQHYLSPDMQPCTKHRGRAERQRYGCNGPDPADKEN